MSALLVAILLVLTAWFAPNVRVHKVRPVHQWYPAWLRYHIEYFLYHYFKLLISILSRLV